MSREIFNAVKLNKTKTLLFEFNFNDTVIELKVAIKRVDIDTEFDIWGSSSDEDIDMNISISTKTFNKSNYNQFNAELREFLRHEMEHIGQYHEISGKEDIYGYPAATTELDYFTLPYEIDAFLFGLNYKRKYLKTNMKDEIQSLLMRYYRLTDNNIADKIENIWYKRLQIILPHLVD
jgi:hypothetical protein